MLFIIILVLAMDAHTESYRQQQTNINGKTFLVPHHNLYGCEKYMLPKLDNAPVHHTFFDQEALDQHYRQKGLDPQQLNHNLDKKEKNSKSLIEKDSESLIEESDSSMSQQQSMEIVKNSRPRPPMRETGYTHFIHVSLVDAIRDVYENQIAVKVEEEDRDLLMPLESMHMTIMVFRMRNLEDLPKWSEVMKTAKNAKRTKLSIRGADIFAVKKNYAQVLYLPIKGAEDLVDRIVSKAIELNLVEQKDLSHIKFDKGTETYQSSPHLSLLRTKGSDLYDFTHYLKVFKNINVSKITVSQLRLSMIGTHDGKDYFNEEILEL